jgi:ribose transport system substrate-binding protein
MVGSWSLFTDALLSWEPGKIKITGADALPAQLPYIKKGVVEKLFAQDTYGWGYRSIELLADKIIMGKDPVQVIEYAPLTPVSEENVTEFEKNWEKWLHR